MKYVREVPICWSTRSSSEHPGLDLLLMLLLLVVFHMLLSFLLAAQVGCFYEAQRFSSIFNALQYDLILLTGDYPLIDFTLLGRYINFVQVKLTRSLGALLFSTSSRFLLFQ